MNYNLRNILLLVVKLLIEEKQFASTALLYRFPQLMKVTMLKMIMKIIVVMFGKRSCWNYQY